MEFDIKEVEKKLDAMAAETAALKKKYMEESQKLFHESIKQFFAVAPSISALYWNQYTPYFNDGDECTFSVGELCYAVGSTPPDMSDISGYESEETGGFSDIDVVDTGKKIELYKDILAGKVTVPESERRNYPYYLFFDRSGANLSLNTGRLQALIEELDEEILRYEEETLAFPNRKEDIKNFKSIEKFFGKIDSDTMRDMFGDHVKVMITREGVTIDEFDHD